MATPETESKSRLMISHMKLVNFKSYAGTKIVGPFHKKFSAVVGPNGSGKSNVIDAMLFVFGRRASKLRLKKVSQLIHNSAFHPDCTKCAVSVYFQEIVDREGDEDGFDIVPDSKFVVTREAFKDNTSHYIIDSKKSNFTNVTTLLKKKGIDLDNNRFLILQGEVEQISLMKPKAQNKYDVGMLEYLEDIIGSNTFVEPIEEAAGNVKQFEDERLLVLQKAVALEKARDELEGSKTEAEEFLEQERQLSRLNAIRAQLHLLKAKEDSKCVETRIQELDQKREVEKGKLEDKKTQVETSKKEYERISSEHNRIAEEVEACSKEWATFERKDIKYREDIKHAKDQAKKAASAVKRNQNKAKKCEQTVLKLEESIPSLEDSIQLAKTHKKEEEEKLDKIYDSIKEKTEQLRVEMQTKEKELEPLRQNVDDLRSKVKATKTALNLLVEQEESGRRRVESARSELAKFEKREHELDVQMEETRSEEVKIAAEEATAVEQLQSCIEKTKTCEETLRNCRAVVESARLAQKQNANRGDVLKALLEAARAGGPLSKTDLYGRLGDLGAIDLKYDVAISTAAGALDHLVVQNTAGAQACIQYLRNNSLGRATFICLDELKYLDTYIEKGFKAPRGALRLLDLVKPKHKRFDRAFFFALRNTLVTENLDTATKIAFSGKDGKARFRVVTLKGQLIDTTGTMSGGGKARKGRMGSAVVDNEAALQHSNAETQFQTAQKELKNLKTLKSKLEKQSKTLKKTRQKLQLKLSKLKMEIESLPEERAALEAELKQAQSEFGESKDDEKTQEQIESLQVQLKEHQNMLSEAEKKASKVKKLVDDLQTRIMDAGGDKLRNQKDAVKKVTKSLQNATKALSKARVDIRTNTKNVTQAESAAADAEKQEIKANKTIEKIRAELQRMDDDAQELLQRREQAQEALKERETALRAIEVEFRKVQKIVSDTKLALVDLDSRHEDLCKSKKKSENVVKHWTDKVKLLVETFVQMTKEAPTAETTKAKKSDDDVEEKVEESTTMKVEFTEEELKNKFEMSKIEDEICVLEDSRDKAKNTINMGAIQEYFAKEAEYQQQMKELESITEKRDDARNKHDSLRKKRLEMFSSGFFKIKMKLKEMYRMLTLGGDAELEQVDTLDPFSEGILFSVRPPRKSWKSISNLSGGEKTLCSLALVFALHHFRPTPLYVMDEIDAALDFKNVSIIANYIKDRADGAQFVVISLRNNMFELADRLVGIYKTNDATKSVTINPKSMALAASKSSSKKKIVGTALNDRTNNVSLPSK